MNNHHSTTTYYYKANNEPYLQINLPHFSRTRDKTLTVVQLSYIVKYHTLDC